MILLPFTELLLCAKCALGDLTYMISFSPHDNPKGENVSIST